MSFGELIRRERKRKDQTQEELGRYTGIGDTNISNYENNKPGFDNPGLKTIRTFATALGIDITIPADQSEDLKSKDAFKEIDLQGTAYDKETEEFIKKPEAQSFIILARLIYLYGIDSPAAKAYIDTLKTFPKNKS